MDLWLFDLDGTLYDDSGAQAEFFRLLLAFINARQKTAQQLEPIVEPIEELATKLKVRYETHSVFLAFQRKFDLDLEELINYTALGIDLNQCGIAHPDVERRSALQAIHGKKVVFTNNPSTYAAKVLSYVGLDACFDQVIGLQELGHIAKPDRSAFELVASMFPECHRIWFCDDKEENLNVAGNLGWNTILYRPSGDRNEGQHRIIRSFAELPAVATRDN